MTADVCFFISRRCESCQRCLNNVSSLIDSNQPPTASVADNLLAWCMANGRSAASCAQAATAIQRSYQSNLGRRAGALCIQLGECAASLTATTSNCALTLGSATSTLSDCTVNGLSSGDQVSGITAAGPLTEGRCLTDGQCNSTHECSSAVKSSTCSCKPGGFDSCDKYSTCQPKYVPPVVTPCQACQSCLSSMRAITAATKTAADRYWRAEAFAVQHSLSLTNKSV